MKSALDRLGLTACVSFSDLVRGKGGRGARLDRGGGEGGGGGKGFKVEGREGGCFGLVRSFMSKVCGG